MNAPKISKTNPRIKQKVFPISTFIIVFLLFAGITTIQMKVIGKYIDNTKIPFYYQFIILFIWIAGAAAITLFTRIQINIRYEKPIEAFASAAQKVADGDFSVYVPPRHTEDKIDELDVIFMDFNTMVEELGSIETLKVDFFSNVSHEIKTPIAAIQNYAELIERGNLSPEKSQEYAGYIIQSSKRLSNLITNMLKLNKLEKQTILPVPEVYNLSTQLCECVLQFENIWEEKQIELLVDVEEEAPIWADESLLELVWNNLLSNAFKFTPIGGTVTLCEKQDEESIQVFVSDTGCGMDEKTVEHIFDKFYQGDSSHSTEGNGLGLALVKRIVQLENGFITVESTPEEGSCFVVTLPKAEKKEG